MRRLGAFLAGSFLSAALALGQASASPPTSDVAGLFQKAKAQVKDGSWAEGLKTLDALEAEANRPGNAGVKQPLAAPLAFYRGVCDANLDHAEQARADFAAFLREQPGATIDRVMYSKKAVAAFDAARKDLPDPASNEEAASLLEKFREFKAPPNPGEKPDDRWAEGPVKWILTPQEKAAWAGLTGGAERAEFVETCWERRNPRPGSPDNVARTGFERRVAFADAYFQVDEQKRGSLTDPGMVFILLGAPSRTARRPVLTGEDPSDSAGMSLDQQWWMAGRNSVHIDGARVTDASGGFREIWHYGREALPKGVTAYEVNVAFVTKKGYGRAVLQREPAILAALDAARPGRSENQ